MSHSELLQKMVLEHHVCWCWCCDDEDGELPELLFTQLSLINEAWHNNSQNTHDPSYILRRKEESFSIELWKCDLEFSETMVSIFLSEYFCISSTLLMVYSASCGAKLFLNA